MNHLHQVKRSLIKVKDFLNESKTKIKQENDTEEENPIPSINSYETEGRRRNRRQTTDRLWTCPNQSHRRVSFFRSFVRFSCSQEKEVDDVYLFD